MGYVHTFIRVAPDCPTQISVVPENDRGKKTIAVLQYELLSSRPYAYTQEDVQFQTYLKREDVDATMPPVELQALRQAFFSKPQACFRASPLAKRYGWGLHYDDSGKIALVARESRRYEELSRDGSVTVLDAMRSKRA